MAKQTVVEKQLTPMQQFIEWCAQSSYSVHPKAIEKAKELLPIEQKAIEDAAIFGMDHHSVSIEYDKEVAKQYYNETYKKGKK